MARRKRSSTPLNAWPGYVDALSTLLMVITFVLLVFIIGQQFLSAAINQREHTLDALKKEITQLGQMLSMSESKVTSLNSSTQQQTAEIASLHAQLQEKEKQLADAKAQAQTTENGQQGQITSLSSQISELSKQLQAITEALDIEKKNESTKDAQIAELGQKLNIALADKVNLLKQYRSEFFGRLKQILKDRPGISIVGDRFVFQSEILFPQGSANLSPQGKEQLRTLAHTFREVSSTIPTDIPWILRVDGHADRLPIHSAYPSNWELSSERAITVVKTLIAEGIDPHHLAATGFSVYQPLDSGETPEAFAHNRRIEFRLTDR